MLANLVALDSDKFYADSFSDGTTKVGAVPMEKFNVHGGSLSIGHPFGATGARLVKVEVARRVLREGGLDGASPLPLSPPPSREGKADNITKLVK